MSDTKQTRPVCPETPDARVRRTYRALHEALGSLIQQRPYERILVKEILARAQVARSTFYAHFHDKDTRGAMSASSPSASRSTSTSPPTAGVADPPT